MRAIIFDNGAVANKFHFAKHLACPKFPHRRPKDGSIQAVKFGNVVRIRAKSLKKYLAST
jgi:hypothetical protein